MDSKLTAKINLFVENTRRFKGEFITHSMTVKRLAAMLYTGENKDMDIAAVRENHQRIKQNTGLFSTFRGNTALCVSAMLSLTQDPDRQIENTLAVYDIMKTFRFRASDYLVLAAYQIAANTQPLHYAQTVERTRKFYDAMKKNRWFITGPDDYIFSAMLGLSDANADTSAERMNQLYGELKRGFVSGNSVQALTQVLVLGGETPQTVSYVLQLKDMFKDRGLRFNREFTYSSLGVLVLLLGEADPAVEAQPVNSLRAIKAMEDIVNNVCETYEALRMKKGFSAFSVSKQEALLYASALVSFNGMDEANNTLLTTTLSTGLTNILLAQQAAMAAAAASAATAAAASN